MCLLNYGWEFVKTKVISLLISISLGVFEKSPNRTFIMLISKKGRAKYFMDFQPINLVGSLYKPIAKVLANRLKKVVK